MAVPVDHGRLLPIEDAVQSLLDFVQGMVEMILGSESLDFAPELLQQLFHSHDSEGEPLGGKPVAAQPFHGLREAHTVHHELRDGANRILGVERELRLASVPTAVNDRSHDGRQGLARRP